MSKNNKTERTFVNKLIKAIRENSHRVYIHVDRDSGSVRHTSSGWDFLLSANGQTVFCEAKAEKGKLSDWQMFVQADVKNARSLYKVIRFSADGGTFTIDGGKEIETAAASFADFIQ